MKAIIATTLMLILLGLPNQQSLDPDLLAMEREIANLVNVHRESLGLDVLEFTEAINQVARQHSFDMASGRVDFGHDGFSLRTSAITKLMGGMAFAENVAYGHTKAENAVNSWLNSSGHKKNIEGNYSHTGVGIAKNQHGTLYFTQIFVKK